jgi:hypothetical protein
MSTYERELLQHCDAILTVLAAADVPSLSVSDAPKASDRWIALRPALRALRVPLDRQRWFEAEIREDPDTYHTVLLTDAATGWQVVLVRLEPFTRVLHFGRHRVCVAYSCWHSKVVCALFAHGYYDPATQHTPPADQQLDALERREEGRDVLNTLLPGMGDWIAGQRPTTDEGRRNLWHLVTDDDGNQTMIRDCDLPDEEEQDDAD